jgi:hypothetical protein
MKLRGLHTYNKIRLIKNDRLTENRWVNATIMSTLNYKINKVIIM